MMRETNWILVTGGAGFIGSHSVDLLLANGYQVRVLDNFSTGRRENLPENHPRLKIIRGDLSDQVLLRDVFADVHAVLHLAAQVSVQKSIEDPASSCQTNIQSFVQVLEMARKRNTRLVYASSAAVYGEPRVLPVSESGIVQAISPYGLEKYTNELYADLYSRMYGLSSLGLRYFNVYGSRQDPQSPYSGVISRFVAQIRQGEAMTIRGDGLQERDFIHVADVARVNLLALTRQVQGVCNIARGEATTIRQLADTLIALQDGQAKLAWVNAVSGDIRHSRANVERMKAELTEAKVPLESGLRSLLQDSGSRIRV